MKNILKMKTLALSITMALIMVAGDLCAQYDEERYGLQPWFGTSLMGKQGSGGDDDLELPNEHGYDGDVEVPIGSGALLLVGFGAAYAFSKKRKEE